MYGSLNPILKGKMNSVKPKGTNIEIILPIYKHHKDLQLYIDFFLVNGYPFLATRTNKVNFITAKTSISRKTSQITKDIDTALDLYEAGCFNITVINGDNNSNINTLKSKFILICTHVSGKK